MDKVILALSLAWICKTKTGFLQGASKVSYVLGYNGKNIRLKFLISGFLNAGRYFNIGSIGSTMHDYAKDGGSEVV